SSPTQARPLKSSNHLARQKADGLSVSLLPLLEMVCRSQRSAGVNYASCPLPFILVVEIL
ncbi:MAG: hypothetical protein WA435_03645, partial [Gallionellaceae bacterium]